MSSNPHSADLYDRLGVPHEASASAVKNAYYSLVREYPPERFPKEFQAIREAYETLSDQDARSRYDVEADSTVRDLVQSGVSAANEGETGEAARLFRRALVIKPEAAFIRQFLAQTFENEGDWEGAREQWARLTSDVPTNATYWAHRGMSEWALDENLVAERSFRRSLGLNPDDNEVGHVGLARALSDQDRHLEAIECLEDAIRADGVIDFEDFTYLYELVRLYSRLGDEEGIDKTTVRIEAVATEEWQRRRAAYQFARFSQQLLQYRLYSLALTLAERSERLLPDDDFIQVFTLHLRQQEALVKEWGRLQGDEAIRDPLKFFVAVLLQVHLGHLESEEVRTERWQQASEVVYLQSSVVVATSMGHRSMADELNDLDRRYPRIGKLIQEGWREVVEGGSRQPTKALLTCPHCASQAHAPIRTARLVCPDCNKSLDYDARAGRVSAWSGIVQVQRAGTSAIQIAFKVALWVVGLAMLSMCVGG